MRDLGQVRGWIRWAAMLGIAAGAALPSAASTQPPPAAVAAQPAVAGEVRVVGGTVDLAALDVRLNGTPLALTSGGRLTGSAADADFYQLTVAGPGIFPATFTFAHAELARPDGGLALPLVEPVARAPGRVELFFGGDAMIGRRFEAPIWNERVLVRAGTRLADMARLLQPMQPYFAGSDLASVNLETVLATEVPGDAPGKSVVFYTHSDAARALAAAGIDYVSLGNNHSYDYLDAGLRSTVEALDEAGIAWSGAGADEGEALRAARIDLAGHAFSMLGYVGWQGRVEPNQVAESGKGGAAFGTDDNIRESVRREAAAGRIPIVQYHGSTEYSDRPTDISERRMKLAVDEGAALVVSHHPHVPQGFELYNGRLIAYSLGNYLFDQYFPETHGSVALKVWLDGDRLFRAEIVPLQILDYRPVPAVGGFRQAMLRRAIALSAERGTPVRVVGGHGVISPAGGTAPRSCTFEHGPAIATYRLSLSPAADTCRAPGGEAMGRDLLVRGDFEGARFGEALDRSWASTGATLDFGGPARSGRAAMRLTGTPGAVMSVRPTTFFRPTQARRHSLTGWISSDAPVRLEALVQYHPAGTGRFEALESAPWETAGETEIAAGEWRYFRFDFELPEEARPMRPMLRLTGAGTASIDDVAFIAWAPEGEVALAASHGALER